MMIGSKNWEAILRLDSSNHSWNCCLKVLSLSPLFSGRTFFGPHGLRIKITLPSPSHVSTRPPWTLRIWSSLTHTLSLSLALSLSLSLSHSLSLSMTLSLWITLSLSLSITLTLNHTLTLTHPHPLTLTLSRTGNGAANVCGPIPIRARPDGAPIRIKRSQRAFRPAPLEFRSRTGHS